MNISLHIIYESDVGRPLTAAKTSDRKLLRQVAETVTREAFERAESVKKIDVFLGSVQEEEAKRLQKVLQTMIPELKI